jgi:septal ring factor EnvC (AmiA/AmiB activator)
MKLQDMLEFFDDATPEQKIRIAFYVLESCKESSLPMPMDERFYARTKTSRPSQNAQCAALLTSGNLVTMFQDQLQAVEQNTLKQLDSKRSAVATELEALTAKRDTIKKEVSQLEQTFMTLKKELEEHKLELTKVKAAITRAKKAFGESLESQTE